MPPVTTLTFREKKEHGEKITMLTAYDFPTAQLLDSAGVDALLIGDSMGMAVMGLKNTLSVTVSDILHHTRMVARAAQRAMVIADMPFLSYQVTPEEAVRNAGLLVAEGGAHAVKLEGPVSRIGASLDRILAAGIPVMGHLGLTPQSVHQFGGFKLQGKDDAAQARLKADALALEAAGCYAIVLECVPGMLGEEISAALSIPVIGIGAGAGCDGQVLVLHDILGWGKARFACTFADVRGQIGEAAARYVASVKSGAYPAPEHSYP